jgi:hypothetical protein
LPLILTSLLSAVLVFGIVAISAPGEVLGATAYKVALCNVTLRTSTSTSAKARTVIATGTKVSVVATLTGGSWRTTCAGKTVSGRGWYRISAVNGKSVKSLYGVSYLYAVSGRFRTATITRYAACRANLRTRAASSAPARMKIALNTKVLVAARVTGSSYSTSCSGKAVSGNGWYRISSVNGATVRSLYGVSYLYAASLLFTPSGTSSTTSPTSSPAACGSSVQARVDAAASGSTLDLSGCSYNGTLRIAKALHVIGFTLNSPAGAAAVTVDADNVTIDTVTLRGPDATTYNGSEAGIAVRRTASNPIRGLSILDSTITRYGYGGMYLNHVVSPIVLRNRVADGVYAGIMVLSAQGGRIEGNRVSRIGVVGAAANSNNAYGIALSHTELPVSSNVSVRYNTVEDVPTWEALDTHGGSDITFANNTVIGSRRGVMLTSGVGGTHATNIMVTGNQFLSPVSIPDGDQYAVAPVSTVNVTISGNTISDWGAGHDLIRTYVNTNLVYSGNTVKP